MYLEKEIGCGLKGVIPEIDRISLVSVESTSKERGIPDCKRLYRHIEYINT